MSKKRKGPPITSPSGASAQTPKPQPQPNPTLPPLTNAQKSEPALAADSNRSFELIRFDRRMKWFLGICAGLFLLMLLAKIHFVSVAAWNQLIPDGSNPRRGLISGEARRIRMDDYAVGTPWFLSQAEKGFPQINETIGGEKAPVMIIPTKHFSSIFKPINWGAMIFGTETAYAWEYDVTIFMSLIAVTFMLMLLTQNHFWLSVFGSIWLLLSTGTQSWTYIPIYTLTGGSLVFVSAIYLLYGRSKRHIIIGSISLAWSLAYFVLMLYPPYQVPIVYIILALFVGYTLNQRDLSELTKNWPLKLGGGFVALAALAGVLVAYYSDLKPTLDAVTNTVYPGKRNELGGTGFVANWASEYFAWLLTDAKYPQQWLNYCELSHYLTFTPIIIPSLIIAFSLTRRIDWPLLLLSVVIFLLYIWVEAGFPEWMAKLTLLNMSPTRRTQVPLGIANVLLAVLYLDYLRRNSLRSQALYTGIGAALVLALMIYAGYVNVNDAAGFFKWYQLYLPIAFFTALGILLLPTLTSPYRIPIFCGAILLFVLPNLRINPVSKGLSPITENTLYQTVKTLHQQEPKARWVTYGSQFISYLVTATGVDLLSGVKFIPPRNIYKVLDPQMKRDSAYNRYAHTVYQSFINGTDSVFIQNNFEDGCLVAMDPCSPKFKQLNVKYIIFDHATQPVETRCMKSVATLGTIQIYRIND
ncbi:DUF7657 domain-containing protein [Spirosoma sp.]|uniref:DUF7657 domain-containing protein n=1 Tax=Spirosoma sp. TaxID=1899569 RepID=UPI003B3AFF8A